MEIIITPDAQDDLDDIFEFIAKDSIFYAELVVSKITSTMGYFYVSPKMGKQVKLTPETREFVGPYKYLIRYENHGEYLYITAIYKRSYREM